MLDLAWLDTLSLENARRCLESARLLEQASYYLNQGEPQSALAVARHVLATGSESFASYARALIADALEDIATQYEEAEDWENALQWRKQLVAQEPSALLPRLVLAEDMIMAGRYQDAEQELGQLLSRCPRSIEGWVWMARCALRRAQLLKEKQHSEHEAVVRDIIKLTRRSWRVLRNPAWVYYPDETIVRVTIEELYEVTFACLVFAGRMDLAHQVIERGIAILGNYDGYLRWLRDSSSPDVQYRLSAASLLSVIDHTLVERVLELVRQCDTIADLVRNGAYEQALARLQSLPPDTNALLDGWRTWQERWLLFRAAENAANAQDTETEISYIAQWRQISPLEVFPLFRWGELMSAHDHKEALRVFHRVLGRTKKCVEALIEVARIHDIHRRLRLASRFVAKAWQALSSTNWCYYPSEAVVRDRLKKLLTLTERLATVAGKVEQAGRIKQEAEALLRSSESEKAGQEGSFRRS